MEEIDHTKIKGNIQNCGEYIRLCDEMGQKQNQEELKIIIEKGKHT